MAHNLNFKNGKASMFYYGEKPWHGLGTELSHPATAAEAIKAAQLDYIVETKSIYLENGKEIGIAKATVREDTGEVLGVVGNQYRVIQNVEAFNFFDVLVGEGQAIYHTAGALGKGERVWILAKLPQNIVIQREDVVEKYLVLTNSHDGTSALRVYFTPIRVVCQNTLIMSLQCRAESIVIRHSGDIMSKIKEARRVLGIAIDYYAQFEQIANQLVDVKLNKAKAEDYFERVLLGEEKKKEETTRAKNIKNDLLALFDHGRGNDLSGIRHTLWSAYNSVVEYVDYYKTVKGEKEDKSNRLKSIWFGAGARQKAKALEVALAMTK